MTEQAAATETAAPPESGEKPAPPAPETAAPPNGETPDVSGLKSALDKERAAREKAERDRKALRDQIGSLISPEQHATTEQQLAATTKERDDLTVTNLRLTVALEKGLPASLARRLLGTTREEIEADADELAESVKAPQPTIGTPDARAGTGHQPPPPKDKNALLRQAVGKG